MLPLIISAISAILAIISNIALFITPYYAIITFLSFMSLPLFGSMGLFSVLGAKITGIMMGFWGIIMSLLGMIQSFIFLPITMLQSILNFFVFILTGTTQAAAAGTGGILSLVYTILSALYASTIGNLISVLQYVFAIPISIAQIPMMIYMCFRTLFINMLIWLIG